MGLATQLSTGRLGFALTWRTVGIAVYIGVNIGLILWIPERPGPHNVDWQLWLALPPTLADGSFYEIESKFPFVWSPVAAWLMAGVTFLGYWPWFALHLASLWLLRFSPLLVLLTATSWALYIDTINGNAFTFVFVAGILALRGSKGWSLVYLALLLLMPRPVQVPLAAVILWRDRSLLLPFAAMLGLHTLLSAPLLVPWAQSILGYGHASTVYNFSPTVWFGWPWLVVGVPLAGWLTLRGHVGWAGLAMSPYTMSQYLLAPLWTRPKP